MNIKYFIIYITLLVSCAPAQEVLYEFDFVDDAVSGPVTEVQIDEEHDVRALLDTGLSFCVISPELAKKLNQQIDGSNAVTLGGFGDVESYSVVGDYNVKVKNDNYRRNVRCYVPSKVEGLSTVDSVFENENIDIILGLDFFEGTKFEINGPNSNIRITAIDPSIDDILSVQLGAAPMRQNLFHAVSIDEHQFIMFLDSGFLFNSALVFFDTVTPKVESPNPLPIYDVINFREFSKTPMKRSLRNVNFSPGDGPQKHPAIIVYDGEYSQGDLVESHAYSNDGFIGWGIMRNGISKFNLTGDEYDWQSSFSLQEKLPNKYNLTGFASFSGTEEGFYQIESFKDISAARESGFKKGDILLSLNGISTNSEEFTVEIRRRIFRGEEGLVIPAVIDRNGEKMELNLTLRYWLEGHFDNIPEPHFETVP